MVRRDQSLESRSTVFQTWSEELVYTLPWLSDYMRPRYLKA